MKPENLGTGNDFNTFNWSKEFKALFQKATYMLGANVLMQFNNKLRSENRSELFLRVLEWITL